jgi:putative DNA primase/helicase
LLAENSNGLVVTRDELVGLLKSLEREGQEPARAFYLEGWDGTGSFETDRISRGNLRIPSVCLSLIGTIQPGPLGEYLQEAIRGGRGDDGLMQRFQLAVWPDDPNEWVNIDRFPDSVARNKAFETFMILDELVPDAVRAQTDALRGDSVPFLRFDDAAQEKFFVWLTQHQNALLRGEEHPAIESHLAKYRSLIPSLALLIHLAEDRVGPVPLAALERAIGWAQYLESHARRIYSQGIDGAAAGGRALAEKIWSGKLSDGFVLRDVYRPRWSRLTGKLEALNAASYLIDLDWLSPVTVATGGAPKTIYRINPRIHSATFEPWANRATPPPIERTVPPFVSCVSDPEAM